MELFVTPPLESRRAALKDKGPIKLALVNAPGLIPTT